MTTHTFFDDETLAVQVFDTTEKKCSMSACCIGDGVDEFETCILTCYVHEGSPVVKTDGYDKGFDAIHSCEFTSAVAIVSGTYELQFTGTGTGSNEITFEIIALATFNV